MTGDRDWDYIVQSYNGDKLMLETRHRGEFSRDMEVAAAKSLGRRVVVLDLRTGKADGR